VSGLHPYSPMYLHVVPSAYFHCTRRIGAWNARRFVGSCHVKSAYSYLQLPSENIKQEDAGIIQRMIAGNIRELQNVIERG